MGDFLTLIKNIHKDKEQFSNLVIKMNPLINKYVRILYKDEKEDVRAEFVLALWEAVTKLKYIENDQSLLHTLNNFLILLKLIYSFFTLPFSTLITKPCFNAYIISYRSTTFRTITIMYYMYTSS